MHIVFLYIYSTNVYSLLRVEEIKEFHVCKIEDYNWFAVNPSITLKQSAPNLHLTINEKVIFWKSQKHWPIIKPKFDTENYACMKQDVELISLCFLISYVGCNWD
jgi:hypothetical protein